MQLIYCLSTSSAVLSILLTNLRSMPFDLEFSLCTKVLLIWLLFLRTSSPRVISYSLCLSLQFVLKYLLSIVFCRLHPSSSSLHVLFSIFRFLRQSSFFRFRVTILSRFSYVPSVQYFEPCSYRLLSLGWSWLGPPCTTYPLSFSIAFQTLAKSSTQSDLPLVFCLKLSAYSAFANQWLLAFFTIFLLLQVY